MQLLLLTHRRADPSFRIRWERFLPAFRGAEIRTEVAEIPERGRRATLRRAAEFDLTVLHRRLLIRRDWRTLRRSARRLVYDFDDALCYRPEPPHRSKMRERRFFRSVRESDLVLAGNRILAGLARLAAPRVLVAPSTVEVDDSTTPAAKRERFTAVWIGQSSTVPHLETVLGPLLDAGIALRAISDVAPPGVEHIPWSLETEAARLAECHVGLMPLPRNRFTRGKCGYKILQYFAAGLPAIASPVGVNRQLAAGGAILAREPAAWVDACRRLAGDAGLRERLGRSGRGFVRRRYASSSLAERLVRILKDVAAN
jgi:glycosyltransferase involved in cell wall biosynthesis